MENLDSYNGKVFCGTFSKNGNYFITASQGKINIVRSASLNLKKIREFYLILDQHIRLYNTTNGNYELFKTVRARDVGWSIIDVAFSPDQQHFVYSTWSTSCELPN